MEMAPENKVIHLMVTILDRGKGGKAVNLYRAENLHFNYICLGFGTASSEILDYLGLSETEKDLVITLVPAVKIQTILEKVSTSLRLSHPGRGILFTLPLSGVSGQIPQVLCKPEYFTADGGDKKVADNIQHDLIITILNRGFTDKVMDAAKLAGAAGGTVLHARRVGFEDAENLLGFTIQPEKEIVAILAPRILKQAIMQSVNTAVGLGTECQGILFSLPVDNIMGFQDGESGR